ncbi:MAG: DUF2339 domain-containing protein [Ruminococcus sp.]|nr:DUF2339 domain-containing protein [Ruminococcus sp.]
MNDPNNINNDRQYTQQQNKGAVSGGEMFVGINLLSKIGVIFIIIGVIAFSAASEGFIHTGIRMAMVVVLGFIMLAAGELFYRKGSVVFSNALIFGGAAELFICSLIGYHGFEILRSADSIGIGFGAAAVGMLLSVRYKSQGLLIVTELFAVLPIFVKAEPAELCAAAAYFVVVNAAAAIVSRKNGYMAAYITGVLMSIVEVLILNSAAAAMRYSMDDWAVTILMVLLIVCCAVCYAGGLLLNAYQEYGKLTAGETALICVMLGFMILFANSRMLTGISAGIAMLTFAVIFTIVTVIFSLRGGDDCTAANTLFNLIFITVVFAVFDLFGELAARYVLLHVFGAALLIAGMIFGRRLFGGWGISVAAFAECFFFAVLLTEKDKTGGLFAIIVNLVLWFGVMAVYIVKKKHETAFFRVYTLAALLNAGIVCSHFVTRYLVGLLGSGGVWTNAAGRSAFSAMLCTVPWLILGFAAGKLKYLKVLSMVSSFVLYGIGLMFLLSANFINTLNRGLGGRELGAAAVIATIAVNAASVLPVLDMTLQIQEKAPKFTKAVGLIVSAYSLMTLTTILGTNDFVTFTGFIISIIYIVTAAVWIVIGFKKPNALLRRFGLALVLLSSAKLFLFDFSNINNMGRTLLFIGFGITLLCIAFGYGIAEKKLKENNK